jgi:hypothetical protein
VVLVLVVLGLTTVMLGFGTSLYVETGARYVCGGTWPESLEGQPPVDLEEPVTAKIDVGCDTPEARLYTFTGFSAGGRAMDGADAEPDRG